MPDPVNPIRTALIANRGEIAVRVARTCRMMGIRSIAIYSEDDADALHVRLADEAVELPGVGARAYLSIDAIIDAARRSGADAIHPGYGFLAENANFAATCESNGLRFIGPDAQSLALCGDKAKARELAHSCDVPTLPGTSIGLTPTQLVDFFDEQVGGTSDRFGGIMIKAVAGGGGRGIRLVRARDEVETAMTACEREAQLAFGDGQLFAEALLTNPRHVEVQLIGDGTGNVTHLFDRDCSLQRRNQKLIEVAPATLTPESILNQIRDAAVRMASSLAYRGLATAEFLIGPDDSWYFMEINPRIQVEHTITEEITGRDLVRDQINISSGHRLSVLGLRQEDVGRPRGHAIQIRVNCEKIDENGRIQPEVGTIRAVEMPSGHGIRVDTAATSGYVVNPRFDTMLGKIIVHDEHASLADLVEVTDQVLANTIIDGVGTSLDLQRAILRSGAVTDRGAGTRYVDDHLDRLLTEAADLTTRRRTLEPGRDTGADEPDLTAPTDAVEHRSPMGGVITSIEVAAGEQVQTGQTIIVIEAMKMQHVIAATCSGEVAAIAGREGQVVEPDQTVAFIVPSGEDESATGPMNAIDLDRIRPDLASLLARKSHVYDDARPRAVAKRHGLGQQTARENVAQLVDEGSFVEYGSLTIAAQRKRRELDDLIANTPADGLITGVGLVNGDAHPREKAECAVLAYDYTVLAGTQGYFNHIKTDRILSVAQAKQIPVILFAEGGGGRPGDVDPPKVAGLYQHTWTALGVLSGAVPLIGIVEGRCFAGNAALLGCCDVIIATKGSNVGMGGPAMIEGGGLGVYEPTEIGPIDVQTRNGVVDIAVADEKEAVEVAKKYLSYFQGDSADHACADQRELRHVIPENRKRSYDIRRAIELICDTDSVTELRRDFGTCMVTALVRLEGRAMGLIANNPTVLGGAIDSDGADKAARFMQLCDAFGLPIISLCDTPGFMVGPDAEQTASVRHFGRMFVTASNLSVPMSTVVLRKGYGLGAMAMAGGSMRASVMTVAWPTGEFGGMGLEGAVRLGFRKELEAIADADSREQRYQELVADMYDRGGAINTATHFEIDDVIDPLETRRIIATSLGPVDKGKWANRRHRARIDAW